MSGWTHFLLEVLDITSSVSIPGGAAKQANGPGNPLSYLTPRETLLRELTAPVGRVLILITVFGSIIFSMAHPEKQALLAVGIGVPWFVFGGGVIWIERELLNRGLKRMAEARKAEAGTAKQPE